MRSKINKFLRVSMALKTGEQILIICILIFLVSNSVGWILSGMVFTLFIIFYSVHTLVRIAENWPDTDEGNE